MDTWIWFVMGGILFSAVMLIRSMKVDERENEKFIEEEGQVFMNRLEEKRRLKSM